MFYKNVYNPDTKKNTYTPDFIHAETKYRLLHLNNKIEGYGTVLSCYFTKQQSPNIIFSKISVDGKKLYLLDVENIQNDEAIIVPLVVQQEDVPLCSSGDLNNDGYADIVIAEKKGGSGNTYTVKILWGGNCGKMSAYNLNNMSSFAFTSTAYIQRKVVADMDKDGLLDIVLVTGMGYIVMKNKGNASGYGTVSFANLGMKADMTFHPNEKRPFICGDFNGDGICDFFKGGNGTSTGVNTTYFGKGDCTFKAVTTMNIQSCPENSFAFGADIDGDGKTEVAIVKNGGKDIFWYRYSGTLFSLYTANHSDNRKLTQADMIAGDVNGDGRAEIITIGASNIAGGYGANVIFTTRQSSENYMGLVKNIITPTRTHSISYSNLYDPSVYTKSKSFSESSNLMCLKVPMCVVKSYTEEKEKWVDGWSINSYKYEDLVGQATGKGLLGFTKIEVDRESDATDIVTTTYNSIHQAKAILYPSYTETKTYWGDPISRENYTYNIVSLETNARAYRLELTKKESLDRLNNTSCITTYSSFSKGQPTVISVDKGANVKSKVEYKDLVSNSTYNIFLPQTMVETQSNGSGSVSRTSKYTYDDKFRLIKSINLYGTDKAVATTNSYTQKGNLSYSKVSASGCETQTTYYDYTSSGRFVSKRTTPDGVTTTYSWNDALGRLNKETTAVGTLSYVTTYNTYDGFNNCLKKTLPDGRISTMAISLANPLPPIYYKVKSTLTGSPDKTDLFDADGNLIRTTTTYADGSVRSDFRLYDGDGRLTHHYFPVWGEGTPSGGYYILVNTYDDFGRIKTEKHPNGTTTYKYEPLKTTITSPLGTKVLEYNKAGQLIKSTENGQSVTFTYTPAGQIATSTALSSSGNLTTTMTYDIAGNRISITDPDVGTIQNEYDAYGRDTYTLTETGREILSRYDSRGRLQSVKDGIDNAAYTYNDNNQLVKEQCNSYSCTYTYDGYNRVTNKLEKLAGVEYQTQYAYPNNYGEVSKITYPSGLVVNNTYDGNGYLTSVSCAGKTIWSGLKMNEYGEVTQETLAGDVVRKYTYNGSRQLSKESAYKGTTGLMDLTYTYSGVNITKKTDALGGNAEQYTYDNLNRLTGVTATKSGASLAGTHTYDALGNMTKTWDNYWRNIKYGENSLPPHKVSSVSYTSSAISGRPTVTFDSYRMPTHIEQGDYAYDIEYRPDHRRCRTKSYKSGKVTCRKYYLTNYEKEVYASGVNREIHYLYGGNGLAAIYVRTDGKDTLFAAVTDRQNSLTAVMDVATGKVEKFSYKPWGMRRNPANWSENVVTDQPARFARGYCMHEHLPQLGLINMGGRIFNERTNQFLSPDPYRQAPESWLNCNRFGYCMGNPVMYTDPDGEWVHILVGLIVGGAINLAANWDNCQGFWQHFTAFAVGAGSGALVAATGGAAGASFGMLVGVSSGSCALTMATNNVIAQTGENFAGFGNVDWRSVGVSAAIGFMSGAVGSVAGYGASQFAGKIVCGGFEIASPALRGAIGGAIGGGFSGYASGFIGTLLMTGGDWKQANKSAFNSMYMGAFLGGLSGFAGGLHYAKKNGLSPWTGKSKFPLSYNLTPEIGDFAENITLYRGTTGSEYDDGCLFMTDSYEYAQTYVKNGGSVKSVVLPRSALYEMSNNGSNDLSISFDRVHKVNGIEYRGNEYKFSPQVKQSIVRLMK